MAASKAGDPSLPSKESALFKTIVKHYETKQYKKGLKVRRNLRRPSASEL